MKKILFFAALSSVALASCVSDESPSIDATPSGKAITFNAPVMYSQTKAVAGEQPDGNTGYYSTNECFRVYANWTSGNTLASNTWELGTLYMNNVKTKWYNDQTEANSSTKGAWFPVNDSDQLQDYYWPKNGYLRFAAYSPADLNGTITYDKDGLKVVGYETPGVGDQYDFMYSKRTDYCHGPSSSNHATGGYYEGVDITFEHALSSIKFKVKKDADYSGTTLTLKSIKIINAYSKAAFAENLTDETGSHNPEWTSHEMPKSYEITNSPGQILTTDAVVVTVTTGQNPLLMIPQPLYHNANLNESVKIEIKYTIQSPGSTTAIEQAHTINLADAQGLGNENYQQGTENQSSVNIEKWEMGKRYTYTITIGLNRIYFNPIVNNWQDVTPEDIDI